jgi:hypothetical protein
MVGPVLLKGIHCLPEISILMDSVREGKSRSHCHKLQSDLRGSPDLNFLE